MRIHHNTLKKATAAGVELKVEDDMVLALIHGRALSRHADPKVALEEALRELNGGAGPKRKRVAKPSHDEDDAGDDDSDEPEESLAEDEAEAEGDEDEDDKSIVKPKYRTRYHPHKMTCGDALARRVRETFMTKQDPDTKRPTLDWPQFVKFAKANGCWQAKYASVNHGIARMSVVNRLRKLVRAKVTIVWNV